MGTATNKLASRIYKLLWDGEYEDEAGVRRRARGDISKINRIVGLTPTEKALVQNYHFMSAKIAGTRQVRRQINHYVFSARIVYGCPVFMTVTPSERHSGLAIRLSRFRKNDPGVRLGAPELLPWIGHSAPHKFPASEEDAKKHFRGASRVRLTEVYYVKRPSLCSLFFLGQRKGNTAFPIWFANVSGLSKLLYE